MINPAELKLSVAIKLDEQGLHEASEAMLHAAILHEEYALTKPDVPWHIWCKGK